jgi:AcrR family transcriptional regulator
MQRTYIQYVCKDVIEPPVTQRTQAERRDATRAALISAARPLFAERGYADVGTEEIVRAAGVTRGALYHHFDGKHGLFLAVFEAVEDDLLEQIGARVVADAAGSPLAALGSGIDQMLDLAVDPGFAQIALIDAPAVLGWQQWREVGWRYGMGLTEQVLGAAVEAGEIGEQPLRPLAHALLGALDEAVLYVARAADQKLAREEMGAVLERLLSGLQTAS